MPRIPPIFPVEMVLEPAQKFWDPFLNLFRRPNGSRHANLRSPLPFQAVETLGPIHDDSQTMEGNIRAKLDAHESE